MTAPLLTARQVADTLGVSAETVLRWTRRGELPAIRLPGGAIRYREDAIDAWLEEREAAPRRGVLPTTQDAASWTRYRPVGSVVGATHPQDEEN
jgi:excisionase family DNA binding protein